METVASRQLVMVKNKNKNKKKDLSLGICLKLVWFVIVLKRERKTRVTKIMALREETQEMKGKSRTLWGNISNISGKSGNIWNCLPSFRACFCETSASMQSAMAHFCHALTQGLAPEMKNNCGLLMGAGNPTSWQLSVQFCYKNWTSAGVAAGQG